MFCSNCGKEIVDNVRFCPECGNSIGGDVNKNTDKIQQTQPEQIQVDKNFENLRHVTEQTGTREKVIGVIGIAVAILFTFLMGKQMLADILKGKGTGQILFEIVAYIFLVGVLGECFFRLYLFLILKRRVMHVEECLKLINVSSMPVLMQTLNEMKCSALKSVYMDENGILCIQGKYSNHKFSFEEGNLEIASNKLNYKADLERDTIAESLLKHLAPEAPVNAYKSQRNNTFFSKIKFVSQILMYGGMILGALVLLLGDSFGNNKYVNVVKNGCPQAYPNVSYGEAFEEFFEDTEWEYFKSTDEQDIVEFHGTCMYDEENANVVIQFVVSIDTHTSEVYTVLLNDEPQPEFVQGILLLKIFEDYKTESSQLEEEIGTENIESVDEEKIEKESLTEDAEVICLNNQYVSSVLASSELTDNTKTYQAGAIFDDDRSTCWSEGVTGTGEGEYIEIWFTEPVYLTEVDFLNGYVKNEEVYNANGKIKRVNLMVSDESNYEGTLDSWKYQDIENAVYSDGVSFETPIWTDYLKMTILEAQAGTKFDDICLSEVALWGYPGDLNTEAQENQSAMTSDLMFPILYRGYADEYNPCPVMVNDITSDGQWVIGTYDEMLASCVNDGVTLYASPNMEGGNIYLPTRWDAPEEEWYNGLLTYDQFLSYIAWMKDINIEAGTENIISNVSWNEIGALAGLWNNNGQEISISIYTDGAYYSAYNEIGTFMIEDKIGVIKHLGMSDDMVYILCVDSNGNEMELCYSSNGTIVIRKVDEEFGMEKGTQFNCIENYAS